MAEPLDRIGTEVLFENDRVRVWDMQLAPGESSGLHRHEHDYLFVYVTSDNDMEVEFTDRPMLPESSEDGFVKYFVVGRTPDGSAHELHNRGSSPHRQIIIEFLDESRAETAQPPVDNSRASTSAGR